MKLEYVKINILYNFNIIIKVVMVVFYICSMCNVGDNKWIMMENFNYFCYFLNNYKFEF